MEILDDVGQLVTVMLESFGQTAVIVKLINSPKITNTGGFTGWTYTSCDYQTECIKMSAIKRVIKRKRGKGCKKKYVIKFIDENGNIIEND